MTYNDIRDANSAPDIEFGRRETAGQDQGKEARDNSTGQEYFAIDVRESRPRPSPISRTVLISRIEKVRYLNIMKVQY